MKWQSIVPLVCLACLAFSRPARASSAWEWHPEPWAICRDGSSSGYGLSRGNENVLLWLQEGGACWDEVSCATNRPRFGAADWTALEAATLPLGIFDRSDPLNPFRDWTILFSPYCSGDWHAGHADDVMIPGVGIQHFRGYEMTRGVARVTNSLHPSRVALGGSSAGGIGAALAFGMVARELAPVHVDVLDDSGPWEGISDCLWGQWVSTFGWDRTILAGDARPADFRTLVTLERADFPSSRFGLIESTADHVIRTIYGRGQAACTSSEPLPAAKFDQGLSSIAKRDPWVFVFAGDAHTSLCSSRFDTVPGLATWVAAFVESRP